jgi:hypothetical protein
VATGPVGVDKCVFVGVRGCSWVSSGQWPDSSTKAAARAFKAWFVRGGAGRDRRLEGALEEEEEEEEEESFGGHSSGLAQ